MQQTSEENQTLSDTISKQEDFSYTKPLNDEPSFIKRLLLLNVQDYMNQIYNNVVQKDQKVTFNHLPPLKDDQNVDQTNLERILNLKQVTSWQLFVGFFLNKKLDFCLILFVLFVFSLSKIIVSILLQLMIDSYGQDLGTQYGYGVALIICNLISIFCQHHFYSIGYEYSTIIRMSIANVIYHKLFRLQTYQIKNTNQGKIINMISADLNTLEPYLIYMFGVFNLPAALIMCGALLWYRFGPQGLLLIIIMLLAYPIQMFFTHRVTIYVKRAKQYADQRVKMTNELIEGIRLIKMYAWEKPFVQTIINLGLQEHSQYMYAHLQYVCLKGTTFFSQMWGTAVFFIIIYYGDLADLTLSLMLSTIQLAAFIRFFCVTLTSFGLDFMANLRIVLDRVKQVLEVPELEHHTNIQQDGIIFENFNGYWKQEPFLKDITFNFTKGLYCIAGKIGSGKTSLLLAIIGEMPKTTGKLEANRKIGYVEQEPFIFPSTFKENILFGRKFNLDLYQKVLNQSNLITDLQLMEKGDQTMIGEKGLTLSGGQKARLSLARALYEDGNILLLDDPLSAVDSKVSRSIFQNLKQISQDKIVLLVTHQIQFAPECDKIIIMDNGQIKASGTFEEVNGYFNLLTDKFNQQEQPINYTNNITKTDNELYKNEESTSKQVNLDTYKRFFQQWDKPLLFILTIIINLSQEVNVQMYFWVVSKYGKIDSFYLVIGMMCIGSLILNLVRYSLIAFGILSGNRKTHIQMVESISKAPISYYDTNPSGRIVNRFSNDKSLVDFPLVFAFQDVLELNSFFFVSIAFLISILPYFAIIMLAIICLQFYLLKISSTIVIDTKECDSIQKSPLFDFFKNTLSGITQIKIYGQDLYFKNYFNQLTNNCIRTNFTFYQCSINLGYKVHLTGQIASIIGTLVLIGIDQPKGIFSQGLLILTIFNDQFQWCMRQSVQIHAMMSSNQRMYEIIDLKSEAALELKEDPKEWPTLGEIQFKELKLRYRQSTPLVLKGIIFEIKPGQRIGCIGRTGAGKSSILQALFRMSEADSGQIVIDGYDISKLGLHKLRENIGIIPQSPFLFSGTIKRNLDPLNQYSEQQLWDTLKEIQLFDYVHQLKNQLNTEMNNDIFSVGQKQLICLARVILSKKKIIVLDEATANLDPHTDEIIQQAIKRFQSTIITIAHRLNTIADYDLVMVIADGQVKEIGKPLNLLCNNPNDTDITAQSEFAEMVKATGIENSRLIIKLAQKSY